MGEPRQLRRPKANVIDGMVTMGNLTVNEANKLRAPHISDEKGPKPISRPKGNMINGMGTVGGLTAEEMETIRTGTRSDHVRLGHERHNKMLARRVRHINDRVDTGKAQSLDREMRGEEEWS